MALAENGRNIGQIEAQDADIKSILTFLKQAPVGAVYDAGEEVQRASLQQVPHVTDINEHASRIVEDEIAAQSPIPTVRRPLARIRNMVAGLAGGIVG